MTIDELERLHAAWQKADEAYRPGAVDDCARADELAEAVNALFDPMAAALPALIECAERLDALVAEFSMAMLADQPFTVEELQQSRSEWERARAALAALKEAGNG